MQSSLSLNEFHEDSTESLEYNRNFAAMPIVIGTSEHVPVAGLSKNS